MATDLAVGDVVQLKSGGPRMTIEGIAKYGLAADHDSALCKWFEGQKLKTDTFELTSLEKA